MADLIQKRRNNARAAVAAATELVDSMNILFELAKERAQFGSDVFADSDFAGVIDLQHLTPGMLGSLYDFVIGNVSAQASGISTWFVDAGNAGRNTQLLLQVRK